MIDSIHIQGLRGIRKGGLADLTPLVVLVGPNGSGKSTILDGILIGATSQLVYGLKASVDRNSRLALSPRWVLWRAGQGGSTEAKVTTSAAEVRKCKLALFDAPSAQRTNFQCKVARSSSGKPALHASGMITMFGMRNWEGSLDDVPLEGAPSVHLVAPHSLDPTPALHQLYSTTVEQGRGETAKEIINNVVPGLTDVKILTEGDAPVVHLVFEGHSVPVECAGDGVHALLRMCLELASRPGGVVLLEEPEVHLHPGAIRQSAKAILAAVRREIQVILTTHSLEFIDALVAEASDEDLEKLSLYRTQLDDGVLKSSRLPGADVAFSRTEIMDDLR